MKNDINIGAAIIVKDAEETIEQVLNSIQSVCKQIVVIDTGSSDRTPVIASRMGAEVYFFKWIDDFSAARNYSLSFLRTEWALIIDADEVLDTDSFINNSHYLKDDSIGGIRVKISNILNDSQTIKEHRYTRIFRVDVTIRFKGKIHEQIAESIENKNFKIIDSEILIKHYGYSEINEEKISRNRDLLNSEIKDNPDDNWLKFHLAETEFTAKNYRKAKEILLEIYNSEDLSEEHNELAKIRLAQIFLNEDDYIKVEEYLNFVSMNKEIEGLRKYILSTNFLMQKEYKKAAEVINSSEIKSSKLVNNQDVQRLENVLNNILHR